MGPQSSDKCPYGRHRAEGHVMTEAEIGEMQHKECLQPQKAEGAKNHPSQSLPRERSPADNLTSDVSHPELRENTSLLL